MQEVADSSIVRVTEAAAGDGDAVPRLTAIAEELSEVAKSIERRVEATTTAERESFWQKHGGTVLAGVLVFAATIFTAVWSSVSKEDPVPDCVAYAKMLGELQTAHSGASAQVLFGPNGLRFGDVQDECGTPLTFFEGLGG